MFDPASLSDDDRKVLLRWRLALGRDAESLASEMSIGRPQGLREAAEAAVGLTPEQLPELDRALEFAYGGAASGPGGLSSGADLTPGGYGGGGGGGTRGADLSASRPYVPHWLGALRQFFGRDVVAMVQRDAVERKGLTELMFEPETLPLLEKNVALVSMLIAARSMIPDQAKNIARQIIREVVDELRKRLETRVRTAVLGAMRRDRHSPIQSARNLDWRTTIRTNLKGWDRDRKRLIPERFHFWANQVKHHEWDVVLVVDQSGSMAESVVYSSVMAAIFASIDVLRTRLIVFDTEVVDLTDKLDDPVEVLFAAQLGGGTDINRAVAYAEEKLIDRPEKTIFLLISDLEEGGDQSALVARMRRLSESRVKMMCLLALNEGGQPSYSTDMAKRMSEVGIPCFACTPNRLVELVECVMRNQPLPDASTTSLTGRGGR